MITHIHEGWLYNARDEYNDYLIEDKEWENINNYLSL